ncbi:Tol-Pal system beta propeller repeat protein TolB [Lysobacter sp. HDW10]|uniref:Tol-Pal system beta propeller repeat protein TolB n=1 Tax=Lysobacter sp. HDW10 TaxID=2714936 RepID=UPI001F0DCE16|nr:Tol-Pal system beta propeller repeat protein TolB [Lysobacter sp. HDW10]
MKRILSFALLCMAAASANAQQNPQVDLIGGRDEALPIAVVPFSGGAGEADVAAVIAADLNRSGHFKSMPVVNMPQKPVNASDIDFKAWQNAGQDFILIGRVSGGLRVEYELFDVSKQTRVLGFAKTSSANAARDIAHQIADDVYLKVTGKPGSFWTRLAFIQSSGTGANARYSLAIADADGYNVRVLDSSNKPLMSPAWSPDGSKIAYVSFASGNSEVKVRNVDGGGETTIAAFKGVNAAPEFSMDGSRIYVSLSKDGDPDIYVIGAGGGGATRLTQQLGIDTSPAVSSDGVYFTSDRGGRPQVYRMSANGGSASRVTFQGEYNADPAVSSDGQVIAVSQGTGGAYRIAVMDKEKPGAQWNVVSSGSLDSSPTVAPNGSMVAYSSREGAGDALHVSASNGRVKERLPVSGRDPAWSNLRKNSP